MGRNTEMVENHCTKTFGTWKPRILRPLMDTLYLGGGLVNLVQCGPPTGPRATCGPPQCFQWPAEAFRKNLNI